jgi:hypothetical protein
MVEQGGNSVIAEEVAPHLAVAKAAEDALVVFVEQELAELQAVCFGTSWGSHSGSV